MSFDSLPRFPILSRRPAAIILLLAALAAAVTGCKTIDAFTGEEKYSSATKGAAIGAAGGAVAGAVAGGRKKILIGAGIGALAGGLIGDYMDRQEAKLREQLRGTGVSVTRLGDQIVLNMPGNVTFATNSSDVSSGFYRVLNSVAIVINEYKQTYVDVVGHTDSTGAADYNQKLSEQRAASVARYLESQKVLSERIVTRGMGETAPVASNDTADGRSLNRRVEIVLTPVT